MPETETDSPFHSLRAARLVPDRCNASPAGYYLHFKREFGEWEKTKLSVDQVTTKNSSDSGPVCTHSLVGLLCGTKYQIYVSAFNQLGTGLPTAILHARTQGSRKHNTCPLYPLAPRMQQSSNPRLCLCPAAPVAPDAAQLLRVNSTSIALWLGSWQDAGCPISSLVLEYKLRHEHAWTLVSNNVQVDRQEYSVLDLSPATWYTLRMTAHNSAGSTVVNYEFVTLTNSGGEEPAVLPASTEGVDVGSYLWACSQRHCRRSRAAGRAAGPPRWAWRGWPAWRAGRGRSCWRGPASSSCCCAAGTARTTPVGTRGTVRV